jgi:transcriptional regulator with XRE-family HTH domain
MNTLLSQHMSRHGLNDSEFADKIGKDRTSVNRWKNGKGVPTLEDAAKIESVTGGEVPMRSWIAQETPA